jgi:hypothetical protein
MAASPRIQASSSVVGTRSRAARSSSPRRSAALRSSRRFALSATVPESYGLPSPTAMRGLTYLIRCCGRCGTAWGLVVLQQEIDAAEKFVRGDGGEPLDPLRHETGRNTQENGEPLYAPFQDGNSRYDTSIGLVFHTNFPSTSPGRCDSGETVGLGRRSGPAVGTTVRPLQRYVNEDACCSADTHRRRPVRVVFQCPPGADASRWPAARCGVSCGRGNATTVSLRSSPD